MIKGYDSSLGFDALGYDLIRTIRESIYVLKKSRKTDISIIGTIYSLGLLIENHCMVNIGEKELASWIIIIDKWKNRVKKRLSTEFIEQLNHCIETISTAATPYESRPQEIAKRYYTVTIKNEELLVKYLQTASLKYPVELGSSLDNYLNICLEKLIDGGKIPLKLEKKEIKKVPVYNPIFTKNKTDYSILITDFEYFSKKRIITAYDLEDYVKTNLDKKILEKLNFDCESSMFSVQSIEINQLHLLNELLLNTNSKI